MVRTSSFFVRNMAKSIRKSNTFIIFFFFSSHSAWNKMHSVVWAKSLRYFVKHIEQTNKQKKYDHYHHHHHNILEILISVTSTRSDPISGCHSSSFVVSQAFPVDLSFTQMKHCTCKVVKKNRSQWKSNLKVWVFFVHFSTLSSWFLLTNYLPKKCLWKNHKGRFYLWGGDPFKAKWIGRKIYLTIMSIFTYLWKKFKLQTLGDSFTDILAFL